MAKLLVEGLLVAEGHRDRIQRCLLQAKAQCYATSLHTCSPFWSFTFRVSIPLRYVYNYLIAFLFASFSLLLSLMPQRIWNLEWISFQLSFSIPGHYDLNDPGQFCRSLLMGSKVLATYTFPLQSVYSGSFFAFMLSFPITHFLLSVTDYHIS